MNPKAVLSIGSLLVGVASGLLNAPAAESAKPGLQRQAVAAQGKSVKEKYPGMSATCTLPQQPPTHANDR
jgi:hypothetical protein